jgi:hypothetical protein
VDASRSILELSDEDDDMDMDADGGRGVVGRMGMGTGMGTDDEEDEWSGFNARAGHSGVGGMSGMQWGQGFGQQQVHVPLGGGDQWQRGRW